MKSLFLATIVLATMLGCESRKAKPTVTADAETTQDLSAAEAEAIAKEAYIYGFPMVMGYKAMYTYAIDQKNADYKGPFNQLSCEARLFTPQDKAVVTPNADTPYCMFWIDLRAEPQVLTVPEIEPERFYHFQLIDLYTHNFAYVGTLGTGNEPGKYLIAGPDWDGEKPAGISDVIRSETAFVFNVTRTQLFGTEDLPKVKKIQSGYGLQPLSAFLGQDPPATATVPEFPKWDEGSQFDERFFTYLDFMMSLLEKPGDGEKPLWDQLARLGIGSEKKFDFAALSPEIQDSLKAGVKSGFGEIEGFIAKNSSDPLMSGKLFGTRAFLNESAKTNYNLEDPSMLRSAAAHTGLYGNSAAEAIYPTYLTDDDQQPFDASKHRYSLSFKKGTLPPAKSFWSLTMYDAKTQLFIENPLNRYLLNSTMMEQFKLEDDGSLVFQISKESPGPEFESNWLPAPDGPFYLVMRLYGPEKEALEGSWTPPPLQKLQTSAAKESVSSASPALSDDEIENLVRRTYPYVAMYNVINKAAMMEENPTRADWNDTFAATSLQDHTARAIARPNNDTLYISTIMDLRTEPVIVSYPAFDSTFVCLETSAYDHYCDVPLSTTKGDFQKPLKILFYSERTQAYHGEPVEGVDKIIEMTGDFAVAFLRVMPHAAEPERLEKNLAAMQQVKAATLSEHLGKPAKPRDEPAFPAYNSDEGIFETNFLEVMQFVVNHTTFDPDDELDAAVLGALKSLGVEPGKSYNPETVKSIDGNAFAATARRIHSEAVKAWNSPDGNPHVYDLFKRKGEMKLEPMVVQSAYGPIGLPADQAVYPGIGAADGKPINAQHDYVIRMTKEEMPPAGAFWSVTLYDAKNGFFIPNDAKKYSVGENAGMRLADDGSIEIHIAAEKPEGVPEENWLPIVRGDEALDIVMRLYAPDLNNMKTWTPPKALALPKN